MAPRLSPRVGAAVLATVVASLPLAFRGVSVGDEGHLVAIADRLAHGDGVLYRDIATNIPPLSYELLALAFRTFGTSLRVERVLGVLFGGAAGGACYLLGRQRAGERGGWSALLAFVGWRVLAFPHWSLFYYTEAATALALWGLAIACAGSPGRLILAGSLLAIASGFKQNVGAFAMLGVLLTIARGPAGRRGKDAALLLGPSLALGGLLLVQAASRGALGPLLHWNVGYFLGTFARDLHVPYPRLVPGAGLWPAAGDAVALFFYLPSVLVGMPGALGWALAHPLLSASAVRLLYLVPLGAAAGAVALLRRDAREPLATFALLSLSSLVPLADFSHYLDALLPAALLLAARGRRAGVLLAALLAVAALPAAAATWARLDTPLSIPGAAGIRVDAATEADLAALHAELARSVPPGAPILALPYCPLVYATSSHENPTPLYLPFPSFLDDAGQERVVAAAAGVGAVVWDEAAWPQLPPLRSSAPRLGAFLESEFEEVARIGGSGPRPAYRLLLRAGAREGNAASGGLPRPASP